MTAPDCTAVCVPPLSVSRHQHNVRITNSRDIRSPLLAAQAIPAGWMLAATYPDIQTSTEGSMQARLAAGKAAAPGPVTDSGVGAKWALSWRTNTDRGKEHRYLILPRPLLSAQQASSPHSAWVLRLCVVADSELRFYHAVHR